MITRVRADSTRLVWTILLISDNTGAAAYGSLYKCLADALIQ